MADRHLGLRMRVFISYASEDASVARQLRDALEDEGLQVWSPQEGLDPGSIWTSSIVRAIDESDAVILLLSKASGHSSHVQFEHAQALAAASADPSRPIVPVAVGGRRDIPPLLASRQALFARTPEELAAQAQRLAQVLKQRTLDVEPLSDIDVDRQIEALRLLSKSENELASEVQSYRHSILSIVVVLALSLGLISTIVIFSLGAGQWVVPASLASAVLALLSGLAGYSLARNKSARDG